MAGEVHPVIKAELVNERVYVGEEPVVRVTLSAPKDTDVSVIKEDRVYPRRAVDTDLMTEDEKRVPGGLPLYFATEKPDDFQILPAGQSIIMDFSVLASPETPGNYTVLFNLTPAEDPTFGFSKIFKLRCEEIDEKAIVDSFSLDVLVQPLHRHSDRRLIKLMNVRDAGKHQLVYSLGEPNKPAAIVVRLTDLDVGSRISAVRKFYDPEVHNQEIWVTYNKGEKLYFMRILEISGTVMANTPVGAEITEPDNK